MYTKSEFYGRKSKIKRTSVVGRSRDRVESR